MTGTRSKKRAVSISGLRKVIDSRIVQIYTIGLNYGYCAPKVFRFRTLYFLVSAHTEQGKIVFDWISGIKKAKI